MLASVFVVLVAALLKVEEGAGEQLTLASNRRLATLGAFVVDLWPYERAA